MLTGHHCHKQCDVVVTDKGNPTRKKIFRVTDAHILRHSNTCALQPTTSELQSSAYFLGGQGKEKEN